MKKRTFAGAYGHLNDLKRADKKICIITASNQERPNELLDLFEQYSGYKISRFAIGRVARLISPDAEEVKQERVRKMVESLKERNPDYLIFQDVGYFRKSFFALEGLCEVILKVAEDTGVIIVSDYAEDFMRMLGHDTVLRVMNRNDRELKIKPSDLSNEDLYDMNRKKAFVSGIFYANRIFYEQFISQKCEGDELLRQGDFKRAYGAYMRARDYHKRFRCISQPVDNLVEMSILVRFLACCVYGKWDDEALRKCVMMDFASRLKNLRKDKLANTTYARMIDHFEDVFEDLSDNIVSEKDFQLFIREYIF